MRLDRRAMLFVFVLFSISMAAAQSAGVAKAVVIHAGRLLDVKTGKTLTGQTIIIQGDKIASVGSDAQIPAGATVIELPNATVLPGLINTFNPNFGYSRLAISTARQALIGGKNARVTLEAGFTTIRNNQYAK